MKALHAVVFVVVMGMAGLALAADNLHITATNASAQNLTRTDGAGFRWDIGINGTVSNGHNSQTYSGGMLLTVNDNTFSPGGTASTDADGQELETAAWNVNGVRVWRRVRIEKGGFARWIDVFENPTGQEQTLTVRYQTQLTYVPASVTTPSGDKVTANDTAFVTAAPEGGRATSTLHVFGSTGGKARPTVEINGNSITYNFNVRLPAGGVRAICLFEAQRNTAADAVALMKRLDPAAQLDSLPVTLRKLLVNIGTQTFAMESIDLPRDSANDLVVLRAGDELRGKIANEKFVVKTVFGKLELPAEKVVGMVVPTVGDTFVQMVLVDGQIVGGELDKDSALEFQMQDGKAQKVRVATMASASYRISDAKPTSRKATGNPVAVLRGKQCLFIDPSELACTLHTEYGDVAVTPAQMAAIEMDTPGSGLNRVFFRNGSVLSGMITQDKLKLKLTLGGELVAPRETIARLIIAPVSPATPGKCSRLALRNEDILWGNLTDKTVTIKAKVGDIQVAADKIDSIDMTPGALGRATVRLTDGTSVTGRLTADTLNFQIENGPQVPVYVGHITSLTALHAAATEPATEAVTVPPPAVVGNDATRDQIARSEAMLARLRAAQATAQPQQLPAIQARITRLEESLKVLREQEAARAAGAITQPVPAAIPLVAPTAG